MSKPKRMSRARQFLLDAVVNAESHGHTLEMRQGPVRLTKANRWIPQDTIAYVAACSCGWFGRSCATKAGSLNSGMQHLAGMQAEGWPATADTPYPEMPPALRPAL